ncbi:hypothetical protein BDA96_07G004900 [Sorghum bicolor]|uniref:Uncharacterized protein n=2 Tax=Sorghum bicolor TaxID=4558 RepID=A0A921QJT1_SORBI|nr:hypothetical protein BDA96_07G004900 [Sorghum bicolor]OQU79758.1 hypothetical protein SORBI_3007G004750 [Sorghum bicolor]
MEWKGQPLVHPVALLKQSESSETRERLHESCQWCGRGPQTAHQEAWDLVKSLLVLPANRLAPLSRILQQIRGWAPPHARGHGCTNESSLEVMGSWWLR